MSKLSPVYSSVVDYEDLEEMGERVVPVLKPEIESDNDLKVLSLEVSSKHQRLRDALYASRKDAFTVTKKEKDFRRDQQVRAVRYQIEAWSYQQMDEEKAQAAQKLLDQIDPLGSIYRESYAVESTLIRKMFDILDNTENRSRIELLGLLNWYEKLKELQNDFEACQTEQTEYQAGKEDTPLLKESYNILLASINNLFSYLRVKETIDSDKYTPVILRVDTVVDEIMARARARKTRKENVSEESQAEQAVNA